MRAVPKLPAGDEPWAAVDETAKHLGIRRAALYRWIERRALPAFRLGRCWQLKLPEVDEGKLVDQDANDEPAEKLLERIRAERANDEIPKRIRRAENAK